LQSEIASATDRSSAIVQQVATARKRHLVRVALVVPVKRGCSSQVPGQGGAMMQDYTIHLLMPEKATYEV